VSRLDQLRAHMVAETIAAYIAASLGFAAILAGILGYWNWAYLLVGLAILAAL
jgi:hypothetical protein